MIITILLWIFSISCFLGLISIVIDWKRELLFNNALKRDWCDNLSDIILSFLYILFGIIMFTGVIRECWEDRQMKKKI